MLILALETSTEAGSCALWQHGEVHQFACPDGRSHSETLLPLVRRLMHEAGLSFGQLDAIAFGAGPGAFTGLRVACGVAQGLAVARDLPLVAISSLETMAAKTQSDKVMALLDARMGEVYSGCYLKSEGTYSLSGEILVSLPESIQTPEAGWLACGNGLKAYPALAGRLAEAGVSTNSEIMPEAGVMAALAVQRVERGDVIDPSLAAPLYVRNKVAKTVAERLQEGGKA